ncbi:MAG: hypothetical protein ABIN74_11825 [Ferruginibacter sp.]
MITYLEYEMLCHIIDIHIADREQLLITDPNDFITSMSFLVPDINEEALEGQITDMINNTLADIKKLQAIKTKLFSLIAN